MKNVILFSFMALLSVSSVLAQIDRGTVALGVDATFNRTNYDFGPNIGESTTTTLGGEVGIGFFVAENLSIGGALGLLRTSAEADNITSAQNETAFNAFGSYYVPLGENFYLPLTAGAGFNSIRFEDPGVEDYSINGFNFILRAGLEYLVAEKIGVRFSLGPQFGELGSDDLITDIDYSNWKFFVGTIFYF